MTVRLLSDRPPYVAGNIVSFDAATETGLVAAKEASTDLTGGTTPPATPPASVATDFSANEVAVIRGVVSGVSIVFGGIPYEMTPTAAAANKAAMDAILAANTQRAIVIKFMAPYYFTDGGFIARSVVYLQGMNEAAPIIYIPTVPNTHFFTWSRNGAHASQLTEELQLNGSGTIDFCMISNRSVRANGLWFNGVDFPVIDGIFWGLKGFSQKFSNSRVSKGKGKHFSYYCGYTDVLNGDNNVQDVLLDSPVDNWDATNLIQIADFQSYFAFGRPLHLDGAYSNLIGGSSYVVHQIPRANTSFEANFILAFPTYNGAPAQVGYSAAGAPLNEVAELHVGFASAPSVANRLWQPAHANYNHGTHLTRNVNGDASERNRIGQARFVGGSTLFCLLVEGGSSLEMVSAEIKAASPYAAAVSWNSVTDTFTYSAAQAASVVTKAPATGTPVTFPSGTLPAGVSSLVYYYLIKITDTTFKIARTYNEAMAGTALDLTDTSTGAPGVAFAGGMPLCVLGDNSRVTVGYKTVELDNGAIGAWHCGGSLIQGDFRLGSLWTVAAMVRAETANILFILRDARVDATGDIPMRKLLGARRYKITAAFVIQKGASSAAGATLGIYSGAAGTGTALAASASMAAALGSANGVKDLTPASNSGIVAGSDYPGNVSAPPNLYVSVAGAVGSMVDVYVLGIPVD